MHKSKVRLIIAAVSALIAEMVVPSLTQVAQAAPPQFVQAWVRPDTHRALQATGVMICATPSVDTDTATEASVVVVFPTDTGATDFQVNATASNWVVDNNDLPSGAQFWPGMTSGTTTASDVTGHAVTFPSGDLSSSTQYCFHITGTNTLTNGSATSSINIISATLYTQTSVPAVINQTNWSTAVITDDTITVSAIVPPNFSIALSANTDAFTTNLDPSNIVSTTGVTVTLVTNAVGGWISWVKDSRAGLYSTTANYTIDSGLKNPYPTQTHVVGDAAFDLVPSGGGVGREGYVMDVDLTTDATDGCAVSVDAAYDSASGNGGGVLSSTSFRRIAVCTRPGGSPPPPGTSDGDILTLIERAVIRGGTPAGSDYSDVITVVGAGNF